MACGNCSKKWYVRTILWLDRMINKTNWKATWYWSLEKRHYLWIGKGFNPDYTQVCNACTLGGDTSCNMEYDCSVVTTCRLHTCTVPTPACPTALPNSTYISNTCVCTKSGCRCAGTCSGAATCAKTGACNYNCDPGYTWNGVACVVAAKGSFFKLF